MNNDGLSQSGTISIPPGGFLIVEGGDVIRLDEEPE